MQSSLAVALRALVMLFCLVALPAWAISGKTLPELTDTVLTRLNQWRAGAERSTFSEDESDATGLLAEAAPTWTEFAPPEGIGPAEPVHREDSAAPQSLASLGSGDLPEAGRDGQSTGSPSGDGNSAGPADPFQAEQTDDNHRDAATGPPPSGDSDGELTSVEQRLRSLGATQYTLEKWGEGSPLFRFQCDVAIAENPDHCRHFEATEHSPQRAMSLVLQQVENWRGEIRR